MSVHDRRGASVLGRRAGSRRDSPRAAADRRPTTRSWCRRSSAGSAAARSRWCSADACRRANGRGCVRLSRRASFPAPVKYGYTSVGRVECGPSDLKGRTVFVLHPHQTRYVVPASSVHVLPADVPPARAVLAANLETAMNGVWDAPPQVGDRIVVIGAGTVGCLVAWLVSRIRGCDVQLVDVNPQRARRRAGSSVFRSRDRRRRTRGRPRHSRQRLARRAAARARHRRRRSHHRRDELVRRSPGVASARGRVSLAATHHQVVAGRTGRAVSTRAMGYAPTDGAGADAAARTRRSTRSSPARVPSTSFQT